MLAYARSDDPAQLAAQAGRLKQAGASQVFSELRRCGSALTPELDQVFSNLRPGDLLAIDTLVSLGSDLRDIFERLSRLRAIGAHLLVLDSGADTRRAISLFDAAALFSQVIAASGVTLPFHQTDEWRRTVIELDRGDITADQAAARHGVSRATVYRHRA